MSEHQLGTGGDYNPFDFSHPVTDPDLFSGRTNQTKDIIYYLDQAKAAPRPFNIALLGPRASGKTTLLNFINWEAKKRNFCVARVDLDEGDAESELAFFFKLFNAIFTAACEYRINDSDDYAFGGLHGNVYDVYLDMISSFADSGERQWRPFIFPVQYAKAMSSDRKEIAVSEPTLRRDLEAISHEVGAPIVVLFDECNVLAARAILLQKVRNLFMNTLGFMLVFAGTPSLFPAMEEVFSPIARDFKKIEVAAFDNEDESRECVSNPLKKIGVDNPRDVFNQETLRDLTALQGVTGGRPYEIQLLCHYLYKRRKTGSKAKLRLDVDVLDDVLQELGRGQDIERRPQIASIRSLSRNDLTYLGSLCQCSGHGTLEDIWYIEYVLQAAQPPLKLEELVERRDAFVAKGLIALEDEKIQFLGDDFDTIYTKYFARRNGARTVIGNYPPAVAFIFKLLAKFNSFGGLMPLGLSAADRAASEKAFDLLGVAQALTAVPGDTSVLREIPSNFVLDVYVGLANAAESGNETLVITEISAGLQWNVVGAFYVSPDTEEQYEVFQHELVSMQSRAHELNGDLCVKSLELALPSLDEMAVQLSECAEPDLKLSLAQYHYDRMLELYLEEHERDKALVHGVISCGFFGLPPLASPSVLNNLGYLFLACDELERARQVLRYAIDASGDLVSTALPRYNLGMLELKSGRPAEAQKCFESVLAILDEVTVSDTQASCLLLPVMDGDIVRFDEQWDIDLRDLAQAALSVSKQLVTNTMDQ